MKRTSYLIVPLLILLVGNPGGYAQGTAFTYQGRLTDGGSAARGIYDLRFTIYDAVSGGTAVGAPITNAATVVNNGLFTATVDAGPGVFNGANRWLDIGVRTNGSVNDFTPLPARQPITPTPYAIFSSASGSVSNGVIQDPLFLGTTGGTPLELFAGGQRALRLEPNTSGAPNVIGGSPANHVDLGIIGATIGGGGYNNAGESYSNRVSNYFGTVGGGLGNVAQGYASFVGGGFFNLVQGDLAVVAGGNANNVQPAQYSAISGGALNVIQTNAQSSYIGGGAGNVIRTEAAFASIVGGEANMNGSAHSVLGGGQNNVIEPFTDTSVIGGGWYNYIQSGADQSVVAGGNANKIYAGARESFLGGGFNNAIQTNADGSFLGAGYGNSLNARISTISGGINNVIQPNAESSFIGGGSGNAIATNSRAAAIGGGSSNMISNNAPNATIGGGFDNTATVQYASIGGGYQNFASGNFNVANGDSATVAGGYQNAAVGNNAVVAGGYANYARGDNSAVAGGGSHTNLTGYGFIGGGLQQTIEPFSRFSVIAGGESNEIHSNSTHAVIAGGQFNHVGTNAPYAIIAGGSDNLAAGTYSFAAGRRAKANHVGTFVWADSTNADFASSSSNQFLIRASGGVGIGVTNPSVALEVAGAVKATSFQGMGTPLMFSTTDNQPLEFKVNGMRALRVEFGGDSISDFNSLPDGAPNIIAGAPNNFVAPGVVGATIAGGGMTNYFGTASNMVGGDFGFIGSGYGNTIGSNVNSVIGGGRQNQIAARANLSTVGGGDQNIIEANAFAATIAGGGNNQIRTNALGAAIGGGGLNSIGVGAQYTVIAGGINNTNLGFAATISGGSANMNDSNARFSVMGGGQLNRIGPGGFACGVLSGDGNVIEQAARGSLLGGGGQNQIDQFALYASLLGGSSNLAHGNFSSIGGGLRNHANGIGTVVPGGVDNSALADYSFAAGRQAVAAHQGCFVWADSQLADFFSTADDQFSIRAAGGVRLNPDTPLFWGTGSQLRIDQGGAMELGNSTASGNTPYIDFHYGFGSQQDFNVRLINDADGQLTVSGSQRILGTLQVNGALTEASTIDFGAQTRQMLNLYSAAYGIGVQAYRLYFRTDGPGGFAWFAGGAHNDNTDNPGLGGTELMRLEPGGNLSVRGVVAQNVVLSSDRNVKAGFKSIDSKAILDKVAALPITRWHYTNETATPHIGPVAQDFAAAFAVGSDDKHIAAVDANGVALAAIQGLHQIVKEKDAKIAALEERLAKVERLLSSLTSPSDR